MFVILQIFFATRALLKIEELRYSLGIVSHVTHLDQSRASENICWLLNHDIHPLFRLNRSFSSP